MSTFFGTITRAVGAAEQNAIAVSVVIPAFNEEQNIHACLRSLTDQQTATRFEVIVVDSSTDGTPAIVQREFPGVRLIRRSDRTFPAEARNIGIRHARGPLIACMDADCIADPTWIEALVRAHRDDHLAVGGAVELARPYTVAGAVLFAIEFSEYAPGAGPRPIRWLPSCNLSVKRKAFEDYGNFPTDMEASEDILFARTLAVRSGTPLWFDPRVIIAHTNRNTLTDFRRRLQKLGYWSGRSRASDVVPGRALVRHPLLVPWVVPYRFAVIMLRLLRRGRGRGLFALCLLCWPLVLYGLTCWAGAFSRGVADARRAPAAP